MYFHMMHIKPVSTFSLWRVICEKVPLKALAKFAHFHGLDISFPLDENHSHVRSWRECNLIDLWKCIIYINADYANALTIATPINKSSRVTDIFCFRKHKDETLNTHKDKRKDPTANDQLWRKLYDIFCRQIKLIMVKTIFTMTSKNTLIKLENALQQLMIVS